MNVRTYDAVSSENRADDGTEKVVKLDSMSIGLRTIECFMFRSLQDS